MSNIAAILELDENLNRSYKKFDAAPRVKKVFIIIRIKFSRSENRGAPAKRPVPDYFL